MGISTSHKFFFFFFLDIYMLHAKTTRAARPPPQNPPFDPAPGGWGRHDAVNFMWCVVRWNEVIVMKTVDFILGFFWQISHICLRWDELDGHARLVLTWLRCCRRREENPRSLFIVCLLSAFSQRQRRSGLEYAQSAYLTYLLPLLKYIYCIYCRRNPVFSHWLRFWKYRFWMIMSIR